MDSNNANTKKTSWVVVWLLLLGLPLLSAFILSQWMGVAVESRESAPIFEQLNLEEVPLLEQQSLVYGNLYFCRLRLKPEGVKPFYDQLAHLPTKEGKPEPPISLRLQREWWDPDSTLDGVYRTYDRVTLWAPKEYPDLVYGVVKVEGDAPPGANEPQ